jgi:hypothetical protein
MKLHRCFHAIVAALAATVGCATAQSPERPRLETNQAYVEDVTRATTLAVDDVMAGFAFVFGSLPERVTVYPTENYYYFRFAHNGTRYAGDIRLDAMDRDQGKLHFGYYEELSEWTREGGVDTDVVLDPSSGVTVERLERLIYRVSYGGKSVAFALNDLSQVKPPAGTLGPDERFVGPIFDESGVRFFFVYNSKLKVFVYVLDETVNVADGFSPALRTDRILIGKRTGFAFYRDHRLNRKILIGAFKSNSLVNNYFDGPFDQLPENFLEGQTLHDLIVDADPSVKGKIDRLGRYLDGSGRYLVHPYLLYQKERDLSVIHQCATSKRIPPAAYYACFVFDYDNHDNPNGRPLALIKRSRPGATPSGSRRR